MHTSTTKLCSSWKAGDILGILNTETHSDSLQRWKPLYHLWANSPTATESQEENMDQKRNWRWMPPRSTRILPEPVHWHFVQTLSGHKHGQIRSGAGKGLHAPDPSQGRSTNFRETIQLARSTHPVHRAEPGRMAKTRSGSTIQLTLQFTNILRTQKARPRTPDCSKTSGNSTSTPISTNTRWRRSTNVSGTTAEQTHPFSQHLI